MVVIIVSQLDFIETRACQANRNSLNVVATASPDWSRILGRVSRAVLVDKMKEGGIGDSTVRWV